MFDTPIDQIVWLVEVQRHGQWQWNNYIHLATRRQARDIARDARRDHADLFRSVRVTRIVARGGW